MLYKPALFIVTLIFFAASCNDSHDKRKGAENIQIAPTDAFLKEINQKIKENPNNPDLFNKRAQYYLQIENIDSAFRDINQALTLDSLNADYYVTLSDIYMFTGMIGNTLAALEKALQINPESNNALLKRAELHLYFSEYEKVVDLTSKAIKIERVNPKAYFIRGMTYKMLGDTVRAINNIQVTVDQDQEYYHAYIQLGLLYAGLSNPLAIDYYNNALNLWPESTEALYNLAYFYQEHDMLNEALSTYTKLLQIDSTHAHAHYNMGYIHMVYLEMFRQAIVHFSDAIKYAPDYVEAYYNRGYCFELLGDIHNARADYYRALNLRTNYDLAIQGLNRLDGNL